MGRTVKQVSALAGVSVRTLHYYDEIALLVPSGRTAGNYRLYSDKDLLRLQQILIGRELGLSLAEIRRSLDDPTFDMRRALLAQKQQLRQRAARAAEMVRAVDTALAALDSAVRIEADTTYEVDMKELFNGFDPAAYEAEADARWSETDAFKESARRAKKYMAEDWTRHRAEQEVIYADAAAAMRAGTSLLDARAMDIAERHRLLIDKWFYPCSRAMHRGLGEMYLQDERFRTGIDAHGEGLTAFLVSAITANADR